MAPSFPFDNVNEDEEHEQVDEELLILQLGYNSTRSTQPSISTPSRPVTRTVSSSVPVTTHMSSSNPNGAPISNGNVVPPAPVAPPSRKAGRVRRSSSQTLKAGKTEEIPAPYPWATTKRAHVYSLQHLQARGIKKISGAVQCKKCDEKYEFEFDLKEKFMEVASYAFQYRSSMCDRAPTRWMTPKLPDCKFCGQSNCVKPEMGKKKVINWLFLLLGQMLGICKLSDLKYFCKYTGNHRTGAKDRVLYLTYLGLLKQLDPNGPFDI